MNEANLIYLASLIDRPGHEQVIYRVKLANTIAKAMRAIGAALVLGALLAVTTKLPGVLIVKAMLMVVLASAALDVWYYHEDQLTWLNADNILKFGAGIGAVLGLLLGVGSDVGASWFAWAGPDWSKLAQTVGLTAVGMAVCALATRLGAGLMTLAAALTALIIRCVSTPISFPVLAVVSWLNNRAMRTKHPAWFLSNGKPILEFNRDGLKSVFGGDEPIYVANPTLRAEGSASKCGVPVFTHAEIYNPSVVEARMKASKVAYVTGHAPKSSGVHDGESALRSTILGGAALGAGAVAMSAIDDSSLGYSGGNSMSTGTDLFDAGMDDIVINPANGNLMVGGIGGLDVMGNSYGTDHTSHSFGGDSFSSSNNGMGDF